MSGRDDAQWCIEEIQPIFCGCWDLTDPHSNTAACALLHAGLLKKVRLDEAPTFTPWGKKSTDAFWSSSECMLKRDLLDVQIYFFLIPPLQMWCDGCTDPAAFHHVRLRVKRRCLQHQITLITLAVWYHTSAKSMFIFYEVKWSLLQARWPTSDITRAERISWLIAYSTVNCFGFRAAQVEQITPSSD